MTRARVDVVIVNWNTHDLLHRCLRALEASRGDYGRIVYVVDNGSTDGSQQLVRSEFPQVHLLENSTNLGFAAANNQAIHEGDAEWVLLLNSDAFLEPETLAGMLAEMGRYPRCAALGCRLVYADGSLQRSAYAFPSLATEIFQITFLDRLFPKSRLFGRYLMTWWDSKDSREADVVMGGVEVAPAAGPLELGEPGLGLGRAQPLDGAGRRHQIQLSAVREPLRRVIDQAEAPAEEERHAQLVDAVPALLEADHRVDRVARAGPTQVDVHPPVGDVDGCVVRLD